MLVTNVAETLPLHTVAHRPLVTLGCVPSRQVVLATNVAETSITIDDVRFVVDAGRVKQLSYDPASRMSSLNDVGISAAAAKQRRGRAGRVAKGACVHLYPSDARLDRYTEPEVRRVPLEQLVMRTKALQLPGLAADILADLPEPPVAEAVVASVEALQAACNGIKRRRVGRRMGRRERTASGRRSYSKLEFPPLAPRASPLAPRASRLAPRPPHDDGLIGHAAAGPRRTDGGGEPDAARGAPRQAAARPSAGQAAPARLVLRGSRRGGRPPSRLLLPSPSRCYAVTRRYFAVALPLLLRLTMPLPCRCYTRTVAVPCPCCYSSRRSPSPPRSPTARPSCRLSSCAKRPTPRAGRLRAAVRVTTSRSSTPTRYLLPPTAIYCHILPPTASYCHILSHTVTRQLL